jgi:hypothetical protein
MISERNDAAQHKEPFAGPTSSPQFLSTCENWPSRILHRWQAAGSAMAYFWACSLPRESDNRLEAKIDCPLSDHRIDPAQFDYREEAGIQDCGLNSQPTLSA